MLTVGDMVVQHQNVAHLAFAGASHHDAKHRSICESWLHANSASLLTWFRRSATRAIEHLQARAASLVARREYSSERLPSQPALFNVVD